MNFKINIFLILTTLLFCACGVKSNIIPPKEEAIPSYLESYTQDNNEENKVLPKK